jgi:hypothetical protein
MPDTTVQDAPQDHSPHAESTAPYTFTHRWPWRRGEFVSMGFMFFFCQAIGAGAFAAYRDTMSGIAALGLILASLACGLGSVYYLYRVKISRTARSQVTITITGTYVTSTSEGALGATATETSSPASVSYRRLGSDELFVIAADQKAVRIPRRALVDPKVRQVVVNAITTAQSVTDDAQDLYRRAMPPEEQ